MKRNYKDCKYCGGNVPFARFRLGYDYCTDNKCVGMGMKNLPVVVASGYKPGMKFNTNTIRVSAKSFRVLEDA